LSVVKNKNWRLFLATFAIGLMVVGSVQFFAIYKNIPLENLTQDTVTVLNGAPYIGLLSNLGILVWCAAATICFFTAYILRHSTVEYTKFFVSAGILTTLVMLDDLFLFHDYVYVSWLPHSHMLIIAAYGMGIILLVARFWKIFRESFFALFVMALLCFAIAAVPDLQNRSFLLPATFPSTLVEDGFTFLAILFWMMYFVHTAAAQISNALRGAERNSN
jgi:hypothetical protein